MAVNSWLSTANGDVNTGANWSLGTVPTDGEDVIIDSGSVNITGSLTTLNTIDLASFTIGPNYTGQVGSSNVAPMKFNVTGKVVVNGGGSQHYLSAGDAAWVSAYILGVGSTGNGNCSVMGAITTLIVERGVVRIHSGTTTTCHYAPASSGSKIQLNTGTITTLHMADGTVDCLDAAAGTITTANQLGGSLIVRTAQTLTTLNNYGGTCWFLPTTTMTTANVIGGTLILAGMTVQTVTTMNLGPNGTAYINQGGVADTIGTTNNFGGGSITTPKKFLAVPV